MAPSIGIPVRLRDPRHTGPNRCYPCTAVNVAIAGIVAALVAIVSIPWAAVAFGVALATIAIRGYLVPGTPTLTQRYLPDRVLAWFEKGPATGSTGVGATEFDGTEVDAAAGSAESGGSFDAGRALANAGVLLEDPVIDDYVLEPTFHAEWTDRGRTLAVADDDAGALAGFLDADAEEVEIADRGFAFVASIDGERIGGWESRAAFLADMAAASVLEDGWSEWAALTTARRSELLGSLRLFVEECSTCGGSVSLGTEVVASCCRQYGVLAATCEDCGARLFEADVDANALKRLSGAG